MLDITGSIFSAHCAFSSRSLSRFRNGSPLVLYTPRACCTSQARSQRWPASRVPGSPLPWSSTASLSLCTSGSRCNRRGRPSSGGGSCTSRIGEESLPRSPGWWSPRGASRTAPSALATAEGTFYVLCQGIPLRFFEKLVNFVWRLWMCQLVKSHISHLLKLRTPKVRRHKTGPMSSHAFLLTPLPWWIQTWN